MKKCVQTENPQLERNELLSEIVNEIQKALPWPSPQSSWKKNYEMQDAVGKLWKNSELLHQVEIKHL